jgi:hypothetical protein
MMIEIVVLRSKMGLRLILLLNADNVQIKQNKVRKPRMKQDVSKIFLLLYFKK